MALPPFRCLSDRHSDREEKRGGLLVTRAIDTCSIGQQCSRAHKSTGEVCVLFAEIAISRSGHKKLSFSYPFCFQFVSAPAVAGFIEGEEKSEANAFFSTKYMY